jgi:hypothetical protein
MSHQHPPPDFSEFLAALRTYTMRKTGLPEQTHFKYKRGDLPKILHWLVRHPPLIQALLKDAEKQKLA